MDTKVRLKVEWALRGKKRGDRGYSLLAWSSGGRLGEDDFSTILARHSPGTPNELPQVTISWAGSGNDAYIGMAFHRLSDEPDRVGRRYIVTRYFCVPYAQLKRGPISYEALYDELLNKEIDVAGPLVIDVSSMRPDKIGRRITEQTMTTAALLLTGERVCIVQQAPLDLPERLRYLDDVAALLPYGMRSKLSASTWTSSIAAHRIRLSFTDHVRDDACTVILGEPQRIPSEAVLASRYLELLAGHDRYDELVAKLARHIHPLDFDDGPQALAVLAGKSRSARQSLTPQRADGSAAAELLARVPDARTAVTDAGEVADVVSSLMYVSTETYTDEQRQRHRQIIKDRELLDAKLPLDVWHRDKLYDCLLKLAFGGRLTGQGFGDLIDMAGTTADGLHEGVLEAVLRFPDVDISVQVKSASLIGVTRLQRSLKGMSEAELITAADREKDIQIAAHIFNELRSRVASGHEMAAPLIKHRFLAAALNRTYPGNHGAQHTILVDLLKIAYEESFGGQEFEEVLAREAAMPTTALFTAAVSLYGHGARDAVIDRFLAKVVAGAQYSRKVKNDILAQLARPRLAAPPLPAAPGHEQELPIPGMRQPASEYVGRRRAGGSGSDRSRLTDRAILLLYFGAGVLLGFASYAVVFQVF
jgi:hypothetical protein